jgi:UDP-2,3-diacylglucosamine pyrophosphatase LpxH
MAPGDHRKPLIMIADAHIGQAQGNIDPFYHMLTALARGSGDVIFLGDIFDLWIALPRYENTLHRRFLAWCRREKAHRCIGYIEGNHEFFLAQRHAAAFTWCTQRSWWIDAEENLFCHGDRINRRDRKYLAFRLGIRNPITKMLILGLPMGPRVVRYVKHRLQHTNPPFRKTLPLDQLESFAEDRFTEGAARVFLGHFHRPFEYRGRQGGVLHTLPDWFSKGWVSVLKADRKTLQQGPWQDILPTR